MPKSFLNRVRDRNVSSPDQLGFTEEKWRDAYRVVRAPSEADRRVFEAGLEVHRRLSNYRSRFEQVFRVGRRRAEIGRLCLAHANRNLLVAEQAPVSSASRYAESNLNLEAASFTGHLVNVGDIIESETDALRYLLDKRNLDNAVINDDLDDLKILSRVRMAVNLATKYDHICYIWHRVLWLDWGIRHEDNIQNYEPADPSAEMRAVASEFRHKKLQLEIHDGFIRHQAQRTDLPWQGRLPSVVRIEGTGRSKTYQVRNVPSGDEQSWEQLTSEMIHIDPYLTPILAKANTPHVRTMLAVWRVLRTIARLETERMPATDTYTKGRALMYAPMLQVPSLLRALMKCVGIDRTTALNALNLLTFANATRGDLWLTPLVKLDDDNLCFSAASLLYANITRVVENWLLTSSSLLQERGPAFEAYVISEFQDAIQNSTSLSDAYVHGEPIRFEASDTYEQIDVVVRLGEMLLVCECKCVSQVANATERHNLFKTLRFASSQARRKADFVRKNLDLFARNYFQGRSISEVHAVIVTNYPKFSGLRFDDVMTSDVVMLRNYIRDGYLELDVTFLGNGDRLIGRKQRFYRTESEAGVNLASYLSAPPPITVFETHVQETNVDLSILDEGQPLPRAFARYRRVVLP